MADFFTVGEIVRYFELLPGELIYYRPFIYRAKISIPYELQSYFITIFLAKDATRKEYILIKGVYVNIRSFYPPQDTLNDCENNEESFYYDIANQLLYIHFNHSVNPIFSSVEYGKVFGYTNDGVRQFNGIDYDPEIVSIPNFQEKVDPLQYTKQAFYGGTITKRNGSTLPNNAGAFDGDLKLFGNDYDILFGKNGDDYNDLVGISKTYITNAKTSMERMRLIVKDKREQESIKIPVETFTVEEYPDIDEDLIGKIKPDGHGFLSDVPGICVNSNATGNKLWYFCSEITPGDFFVFANKNDNWELITPIDIYYSNGIIELSITDSYVDGDSDNGLLEIKATGYFIDFLDNLPPDFIRYWNDKYLNITFNDSNYNITEWNEEKQYLREVSIYMDNQRDIFEWIGILQASSTVGFLYRNEFGKRTIRLDNPNRNPVMNIEAIDIINNNNLEKDDNAELFATHAKVYYNKKYSYSIDPLSLLLRDTIRQNRQSGITVTYYESATYENRDYYDAVYKIHRKDKVIELETLLLEKQDAIDKSVIIMEDQQKTRPIVEIEVWGKEYFQLRLYDIINAELSFPGKKIDSKIIDIWEIDITSTDIYEIRIDQPVIYEKIIDRKIDKYINRREFMGWQRMQIIGRKFNFNRGTVTLILRQRDFSEKYQEITGFIGGV